MLSFLSYFADGISKTCSDSTDICVKSLPQPGGVTDGSIAQTILQIVIGIVAAVCVLFIAIGGVRYIVSQGDPQGVSKAKATIVFALIGLVITILAQGIVIMVVKAVS